MSLWIPLPVIIEDSVADVTLDFAASDRFDQIFSKVPIFGVLHDKHFAHIAQDRRTQAGQ
jgi:hypothetical protein